MDPVILRRLYPLVAAVVLAYVAGVWLLELRAAQLSPLRFDDAYMFARYAANIRHGLGVSWNLDGIHTYGETSPLWGFVVLLFSYLPISTWKMLVLASWVCSIAAVVAMAWACAANAQSAFFSSTWRVLPLVAAPLLAGSVFTVNQVNGMETMLATLLIALFVGLTLRWSGSRGRPEYAALTGILLFITRPEATLVAVLLPLLLFFLQPKKNAISRRSLAIFFAVLFAGIAIELFACKLYFHTMLPLSFYMKARHAYLGYRRLWHPGFFLLDFLFSCQVFLAAVVFLGWRQWRFVLCFFLPAFAIFAYLQTVTQIMGWDSRYYCPFFPLIIVPALLVVDRWLAAPPDPAEWTENGLFRRSTALAALLVFFLASNTERLRSIIRSREDTHRIVYEPAVLTYSAHVPLPTLQWGPVKITDMVVAPLPRGATVAASEVGYLGQRAEQVNIIDLAGLNDPDIALHGFDMGRLLNRKPDIIWMPHDDYTYQRGVMLSDPRLLQQYVLYAGAAGYGIAVRKDSQYRDQIEQHLRSYFADVYPGYSMDDYIVQSAAWSGRSIVISGD